MRALISSFGPLAGRASAVSADTTGHVVRSNRPSGGRIIVIETFAPGCEPRSRPMHSRGRRDLRSHGSLTALTVRATQWAKGHATVMIKFSHEGPKSGDVAGHLPCPVGVAIVEHCLHHITGDDAERAHKRGEALRKRRIVMQAFADFATRPPKNNVTPMKAA